MRKTSSYACFSLLFAVATIITQIPTSKPPLSPGRCSDSFATPAKKEVSQASRQHLVEAYGRLREAGSDAMIEHATCMKRTAPKDVSQNG